MVINVVINLNTAYIESRVKNRTAEKFPVSNSNHKVCVFVFPILQKVNTSGNKYFLQTISMSIRFHPFMTAQRSLIINYCFNFTSSLLITDISQTFKVVVIKPLLKKPLLDSTVLANFRLISSLPLISKTLERVDINQLCDLLQWNDLEFIQSEGSE